jgi:hypothetical protein
MKTKILTSLVVAGVLAGSSLLASAEHQINFNQLPAAVQQAINNARGPAGISAISRTTHEGIPLYNVRLSERGTTRELYVTETGTVVNPQDLSTARPPGVIGRTPQVLDRPEGVIGRPQRSVDELRPGAEPERPHVADDKAIQQRPYLADAKKVQFDQLPEGVQKTVRRFVDPANIEDIDHGRVYGRTAYEVGFKHQGQHVELLVGEDGSLVRDAENERFLAKVGQLPPQWRAAVQQRAPLFAAHQVNFNQLPEPVQDTLRHYSGGARISNISSGTLDGQTVYEAAFPFRGQQVQLRVREDGWLLEDAVNQRFLAQFRRDAQPAGVGSPPRSWDAIRGGGVQPDQR